MADDPIVGLASDPEFGQAPVNVQRLALSAHDPDFARASDGTISQFVAAHQATSQQATQKIKSIGEQAMTGLGGGPNEREQTPQMKAQRAAGAKSQTISATNALPAVGMAAGGLLASPTDTVFGPFGTAVGAGLGGGAGTYAKNTIQSMLGVNTPPPAQQAVEAGKNIMTGAEYEMGFQSLGAGLGMAGGAAKGAIKRMAGVPEGVAKAKADYASAVAEQENAIRARVNKYKQTDIDTAQANAEQQAKYQQAQADTAAANQKETLRYKADLAATKAGIPPQMPPEQELWTDLNTSLQVQPAKGVKLKTGAPDLSSIVQMPGRGLAQEGFSAVNLAHMSPMEQAAAIAPKWNAAGQAVDATVAKASAAGTKINLFKLDEAIDGIEDPNVRKSVSDLTTRIGNSLGLRGNTWGEADPKLALELRRQLYDQGGRYAKYVSRAVTQELRAEIPELGPIDQHYADMRGAMDAATKNLNKAYGNKFTPTQFVTQLPTPPNIKPSPEAPTPITPTVGYGETSKIAPAKKPDLDELEKGLVKKFGRKVALGAAGVAGAGTVGGIVDALIQGLKNKPNPNPAP